MSGTGEHRRGGNRAVELLLLLVLVGLMYLASHATPEGGGSHLLAALGFLLLAGTVVANVLEPLGIPHLTAYLLTGMVAGPYAEELVDHQTVEDLSPINALALSLISLAGGAHLRISMLVSAARSLLWSDLAPERAGAGPSWRGVLRAPPVPALRRSLPVTAMLGVSLLWGMLAITRSPSATLGVLSQTRARGRLSDFTLGFVMTSDVVVVVFLAVVLTIARPLVEPGAALSLRSFRELGHEVLGSVALGTTLGLLLAAYLRFVGQQLVLVFVALGLVMTHALDYLRFDWLLIFITAGFVVQNLSRQGERFVAAIERLGEIVFVIFFAIAGAHLNLSLLAKLWPLALTLALARAGWTWSTGRLAGRLAGDAPALRRWGWSGLVSQAGLALGHRGSAPGRFPSFGASSRARGGHRGHERDGRPRAVQDRAQSDGRVRRASGGERGAGARRLRAHSGVNASRAATEEVGVGDDAHQMTVRSEDRKRPEPMLEQQLDGLEHRRVDGDRHRVPGHRLPDLDRLPAPGEREQRVPRGEHSDQVLLRIHHRDVPDRPELHLCVGHADGVAVMHDNQRGGHEVSNLCGPGHGAPPSESTELTPRRSRPGAPESGTPRMPLAASAGPQTLRPRVWPDARSTPGGLGRRPGRRS